MTVKVKVVPKLKQERVAEFKLESFFKDHLGNAHLLIART